DLVEIADRPHPRGHGERAILPDRLPSPDNVPSRQVAGGEIVVAGDGHQRAAELPRSVLHEARLAATGGALQHHGETPPVTLLEDLDLVAEGQVKRLLLQDAKTFRYLAIDGTRCFSHSSPQIPSIAYPSIDRISIHRSPIHRRCTYPSHHSGAHRHGLWLFGRRDGLRRHEARWTPEEINDEQSHPGREQNPRGREHEHVHLDLHLCLQISEPHDPLEIRLRYA